MYSKYYLYPIKVTIHENMIKTKNEIPRKVLCSSFGEEWNGEVDEDVNSVSLSVAAVCTLKEPLLAPPAELIGDSVYKRCMPLLNRQSACISQRLTVFLTVSPAAAADSC